MRKKFLSVFIVIAVQSVVGSTAYSQEIGIWERYVVALENVSYSGNPFELEVDATFTHVTTGTKITLPGYYAGSNLWKVGFMPTRLGDWSYVTSSADPELNGATGSVSAVPSTLAGMLKADPQYNRKWRFSDGAYVTPIALRVEFFSEPADAATFANAADFMRDEVRGHMFETRLLEEYGQFGGRHDYIFEGDWRNHRFDLAQWDQMEQRMTALTERGLGAHVMFYSDDGGAPGWSGQSSTEALVIRYVVARLAGFPVVWFNSGIDIAEYRSNSDINWWGDRIRALDPYDHPVSSREHIDVEYSNETFDSRAFPNQALIAPMIEAFSNGSKPASFDDAWGENRGSHSSKDHSAADIRRAFWKATVAGGVGGLIRGGGDGLSQTGFFSLANIATDLESEQWLRLVNPFIEEHLGDRFATMVPAPELVSGDQIHALADPARSRILILALGANDRYDSGGGGNVTVDLTNVDEALSGFWFDPRTGTTSSQGTYAARQTHVLSPPSTDDWVFVMTNSEALTQPAPITDLRVE